MPTALYISHKKECLEQIVNVFYAFMFFFHLQNYLLNIKLIANILRNQ